MDCIVCGTYPRSKIQSSGGDCPVCGGRGSADVVKSYQRCCICFIPLWKCGQSRLYGRCERCGSLMPAAAARARLAEAYPPVSSSTMNGIGEQQGYYSDVPTAEVAQPTYKR